MCPGKVIKVLPPRLPASVAMASDGQQRKKCDDVRGAERGRVRRLAISWS